MVVNNLPEINNAALLNLDFSSLVKFNSRSVHESQVSDVVLASFVDDHELGLPEFLVIGNLIVVRFSLTNLEDSSVPLESDFDVLQFCSVDTFEFKFESLLRELFWTKNHFSSLEFANLVDVLARHIFQTEVSKLGIVLEVLHSWIEIVLVSNSEGVCVGIAGLLELSLVQLELVLQCTVSVLVHCLGNEVFHQLDDDLAVFIDAHHVVVLGHELLPLSHVLGSVRLDLVDFSQLP